jgi:type II secretory pathway component GspD/PulD (secretin)
MEAFMPAATNEIGEAFETKLSASIPEGQTLAFGGWTIGADKRAVAFVYPAVQAGDGTNAQVVIRTTLMEVPPEIWGQLGLADIKADPQLASQSGLVSQQQAESLIASLTSQTNCLILNRPVIQTSDGAQASLFVGEVTASNQQKGLSLDCLPQLGPDGRTVNLTLGMKFDPPSSAGH